MKSAASIGFGEWTIGRKSHQRKNVALDINARRHLDQFEALRRELENTSLRYVEHRLPVASRLADRKM